MKILYGKNMFLVCLKKAAKNNDLNVAVHGQKSQPFWNGITIRPDIVIEKEDETFIIYTKWKNINGSKPSTDDLRQMYVYNDYWKSTKAMLLYPSNTTTFTKEDFIPLNKTTETAHHECGIGEISFFDLNNKTLDKEIGNAILKWFNII